MKLSDRLARAAKDDAAPAGRPTAATPAGARPTTARTRRAPSSDGTASRSAAPAPAPRKAPAKVRPPAVGTPDRRAGGRRAVDAEPLLGGVDGLRAAVRAAVVEELGPSLGGTAVDEALVRSLLEHHLDEASRSSRATVGPAERAEFLETTLADMLGWGPLTPLMADPSVTEVMVNAVDSVWVERAGVARTHVRPLLVDAVVPHGHRPDRRAGRRRVDETARWSTPGCPTAAA